MIYVKVGNTIKEIKGVYFKVGNEIRRLIVDAKVSADIKSFIQYTLQKTLNYSYPESSTQSNSHIFNVPNLISVDEITVNVGTVSFTVNVDNITVVVNNATPTRSVYNSQKFSMAKTSSLSNSTNIFDNSISSVDGDYSGILMKSGTSSVLSGAYIASDTKFVTAQPSANYNTGGYIGTLAQYVSSGSYILSDSFYVSGQGSSYYDSGGYSGTLSLYQTGGSYTPFDSYIKTSYGTWYVYTYMTWDGDGWNYAFANYAPDGYQSMIYGDSYGYEGTLSMVSEGNLSQSSSYPSNPTIGSTYLVNLNTYSNAKYEGLVSRPASEDTRTYAYHGTVTRPASDTRTYAYQGNVTKPASDTRTYIQNYSGTLYKGGNDDYYKYDIIMKYTV